MAQVRSSDEAASRNAFEVLYDRHHRGVLAFCRHMLGSLEEAEDAVQHTFSAAYRALLADDRDIALRAWLYAIARNRCLSLLAARRDQVALDDVEGVLASTAGLAFEVEQRSELRELLGDLQRLPADQRAALILSELEAHSHKEIGDILGVPPAKVKALVFQAREALMIRRQARDTDCAQIREQLSILRGGALRRRELRRHVEVCVGCQAFEAEVRRQRAGMAIILPVAPTLALKHSTLASAFAATGTSATAGVGALTGGGVVAGGMAVGTKAIAAKALVALAVAGGAGGGGYVAVNELRDPASTPGPAPVQQQREGAGAAGQTTTTGAPIVAPTVTAGAAASGEKTSSGAAVDGRERATERSDGKSGGTASAGRSETGAEKSAAGKAGAAANKSAAGSKSRAAARRAAQRAAARREAARRAAAERRRLALLEAERRRRAAEAARKAAREKATPPPPVVAPAVTTPTPTTPTTPTTPAAAAGDRRSP